MIEVVVFHWSANKSMEVAKELRDSGYIQGTDFDFSYHPPIYKDWSGDVDNVRHTIYKFYKEELATWFRLRYE